MSMMPPSLPAMTSRQRRRFAVRALVQALATTALVLLLYYVVPLDRVPEGKLFLVLGIELLLLVAVVVWEVRRVLNARTPLMTAIEALAVTVPLFLVVFAAMYFVLATNATGNFNVDAMTRTDSLYFTVTVFTTVGFGDITATSQLARGLVTVQMILDLIVIGLVIRVFFGAVQEAWRLNADATSGEVRDAIADSLEDDPATGPGRPGPE